MPIPSSKELRDNPTGRMTEGWNVCKKVGVRTQDTKDGSKTFIVLTLRNEAGEEQEDWLDINSPKHRYRFATLSSLFNLEWGNDATESTVAKAFDEHIDYVDAKIEWAKGDKAYVSDYATANEGADEDEKGAKPKPTTKVKDPEPEPEPEVKKKPSRW